MSGLQLVAETRPPSVWHMYRAMVGVGLICGVLIVSVFLATEPVIRQNRAEALQRAIFQVLPQASASAAFRLEGESFVPAEAEAAGAGERRVYAGYDGEGRLVGLALEAQGMGYADVIRLLYGYSFEQDAVIGIRVLESKETPGLGDRIEKDPEFLANFERLDASLGPEGETIANPIVPVKHGDKEHPWEVDGITGATISSVAVANILRESTSFWVPRIERNLQAFRGAGEAG